MLKKTLAILVAFVLVTTCVIALPVSTSAKHVVEEELLVYDSPQSYKELLADYVDLEEFENYMQPLLAQCEAQIDLGKYDLPNDQEVLNAIARYITYFMPDAFHFHTASFTSLVGKVKTMTVQYAEFADEPAEYAACKEEFVHVVNKMTADLLEAETLTDVEIALLLHDRLAVWNEYDEANYLAGSVPTVSFTAYGALVNRTSVCQGYALAYEYLLDMFDIKSEVCSSKLLNHAWNIVYIDDKAYHVDVTWDDPTTDTYGRVLHTNFLRSAKGIASTGHKGESGQIDYDTSATDTTYDNAYWQKSTTEFQYFGADILYFDNDDKYIKNTQGEFLFEVEGLWMADATHYYADSYTRLSQHDDVLLYSTPDAVYAYDPYERTSWKVYTPEKKGTYYSIYGFTCDDGEFVIDMSSTPSFTLEAKNENRIRKGCHFYLNACDATCNLCGETRTVADHKYDNACDKDCNVCGATRTVAAHKYDNACDKDCNVCGATRTVAGHKYDNACDKDCNVCGATRTVAAHKYDNACDKTCNVCGATRTVAAHKYDNACDKTCNVCKATRTTSHSYQKVVTKATLSANGKIVNKCKVCGYTASTTTTIYRPYSFKLSATSYTYNGGVKTPTVTVKDSAGKTISSSNYTVTYASGRKNAGTYTVKVTMKGNYSGTKTLSFKINPIDISKCSVKLSATSYTYNGAVKTPSVTVKNASGTKLTKDTHYTVTYASGRKNAGTYTVKVTMKGNYTGTKTLTFKINPINISKCKLSLSATTYTYDGKVKKPTVTVKNASGTKLTTSSYTATYASGRKNVGTYKVTVKMKGNYTGSKTLTFKINPAKTTVSKITPATKSLKVAITKKSTQVTGYQVQYSTSKSFKSYKTVNISSYKTTSTTLKSLKAKTTYYVRVRTYKTVNGTKYYSGWSTVKYAKTK